MFMKPIVLSTGWTSVMLAGLPLHAETYGTLFTNQPVASFSLDRPERETRKWLMTLPKDEASQDLPKAEGQSDDQAQGKAEPPAASAAPPVLSTAPRDVAGPPETVKEPPHAVAGASRHIENATAVWTDLRGRTANGEQADPTALTAAHKTLPLGSRVRVVNRLNGKSALVRINDRVARAGMIILSEASAKAIGMKGTAPVALSVEQVETASVESFSHKTTLSGRSVLHDHPWPRRDRKAKAQVVTPVAAEPPQQQGLFRSLFGAMLTH